MEKEIKKNDADVKNNNENSITYEDILKAVIEYGEYLNGNKE